MGLSTSQLREAWNPPCNSASFVTIELYGSGRVTVDPRTVEAVFRLDDILEAWGYQTRRDDTGAYSCRTITGGSGYSLHAYGIALDINWQTNPYGPNLVTDMPRGMVDDIIGLRTNNGKRVWEWGGDWSGNKDAMHYEIDCAPADLATGIAGSASIPEPSPEPETLQGDPDMFITIDGRGKYALMGLCIIGLNEEQWNWAVKWSPKVPVMALPSDVPDNLEANLLNQMAQAIT